VNEAQPEALGYGTRNWGINHEYLPYIHLPAEAGPTLEILSTTTVSKQ